ncbi:MAG: T9SS type A sorting domain-containing protein, partial [bacterium]
VVYLRFKFISPDVVLEKHQSIWAITSMALVQLPAVKIEKIGVARFCHGDSVLLTKKLLNPVSSRVPKLTWKDGHKGDTLVIKSTNKIILAGIITHSGDNDFSKDNEMENDDTVDVTVQVPFDERIFLSTVDPGTGKNLIVWRRTLDKATAKYRIYKNISSGIQQLGEVHFDSLPVFIDESSEPWKNPAQYVITTIDTCGAELLYAQASTHLHQTMYLSSRSNNDGSILLKWNPYKGFDFDFYYIFRGSGKNEMELYDSVAAKPLLDWYTYTDYSSDPTKPFYRVEVDRNEELFFGKKSNSGPFSRSLSNLEDNRQQGTPVDFFENKQILEAYPNPFVKDFAIDYALQKNEKVVINLYNMHGQLIKNLVNDYQEAGSYKIYVTPGEPGIFFLEFISGINNRVLKLTGVQ